MSGLNIVEFFVGIVDPSNLYMLRVIKDLNEKLRVALKLSDDERSETLRQQLVKTA